MHWIEVLSKDPVGSSLIDTQFHKVQFVISPPEFKRADINPRLQWESVKFESSSTSRIPKEPGLYAFIVKIPFDGLPVHSWVMYVGQTGDGTSRATLHSRFGQYLKHQVKSDRPKIYYLLNAWAGHLDFVFARAPSRKSELEKLETELLGAFRPPFTDRTYPAAYMSPIKWTHPSRQRLPEFKLHP